MSMEDPQGVRPAQALLVSARVQFAEMRAALETLRKRLKAGDAQALPGVEAQGREFLRALNTVIEQEARLEERARAERGVADGYAIDLDAARAEVGRRLARLRAAGGDGELS